MREKESKRERESEREIGKKRKSHGGGGIEKIIECH